MLAHSAFLLEEDFPWGDTLGWLSSQCGLTDLSADLERILRGAGKLRDESARSAAAVRHLMEYVRYTTDEETDESVKSFSEVSGMGLYDRRVGRAEHFMAKGRYAAALNEYDRLLERLDSSAASQRAYLLHQKGVICGRLFLFERAQALFLEAYEAGRNEESYLGFLAAKRLCVDEQEYVDYVASHPQAHRLSLELEDRWSRAEAEFDADRDNMAIRSLTLYRSEGRMGEYRDRLNDLTDRLDEEYRTMVDGTWAS